MSSLQFPKTDECRAEGFNNNDDSMPASASYDLELPSGSVDSVAASSSTKRKPRVQISSNESSTGTHLGVDANSLGEKRKKPSSLQESISRPRSISPLPLSSTIPSSGQGQYEKQRVQRHQQRRTTIYLRDLMFNSDLLGPIPNSDIGGNAHKKKEKDDNTSICEGIVSNSRENDLFYNDREGAMYVLSANNVCQTNFETLSDQQFIKSPNAYKEQTCEDAGNTNVNQGKERRKNVVRFVDDKGSCPELIEHNQMLSTQSMQGCVLDIFNEVDGCPYDIENNCGNQSTDIKNFHRKMYENKDDASNCEFYSDEDEDTNNPPPGFMKRMFYSLSGIALAAVLATVGRLASHFYNSTDEHRINPEGVPQGPPNTVDTIHTVETSINVLNNSSIALTRSSNILQTSTLNSGTSLGASTFSASSSAVSPASAAASFAITSTASASMASSAASSTASLAVTSVASSAATTAASPVATTTSSTVTTTTLATVVSSTTSAASIETSASSTSVAFGASETVSTSVSAAVATQTAAVATQ